jgi:hypothetical protein
MKMNVPGENIRPFQNRDFRVEIPDRLKSRRLPRIAIPSG